MKGEAFFNVTPNKKKPFVISVNDVQITVVGTSFNVKTINGNTDVVVETGVVKVTRAGKTVELKANEEVIVNAKDSALTKEKVSDQLYKYYRTKEFVCDDTPLWKLVEVINEAYSSHIVIGNPALRDMSINTTFNNESLEQILNVISLTLNIKILRRRRHHHFTITDLRGNEKDRKHCFFSCRHPCFLLWARSFVKKHFT